MNYVTNYLQLSYKKPQDVVEQKWEIISSMQFLPLILFPTHPCGEKLRDDEGRARK